jgi:hypothetical protein
LCSRRCEVALHRASCMLHAAPSCTKLRQAARRLQGSRLHPPKGTPQQQQQRRPCQWCRRRANKLPLLDAWTKARSIAQTRSLPTPHQIDQGLNTDRRMVFANELPLLGWVTRQVEILKLENSLAAARHRLGEMRKISYQEE